MLKVVIANRKGHLCLIQRVHDKNLTSIHIMTLVQVNFIVTLKALLRSSNYRGAV